MKPSIPFTTITLDHKWQVGNNYIEQSYILCIDVEPDFNAAYYWAQQFWFYGGNGNEGGYFGIQSCGSIHNSTQKIAIFSIWRSLRAEKSCVINSSAEPFNHEGSGFSCKIPFPWEEGRKYKLTIRKLSLACWEASITDLAAGAEYSIGNITIPEEWGNLKPDGHFFIEYFRPIDSCEDLPYAKATYNRPVMANSAEVYPVHHNSKVEGPCEASGTIQMSEGTFVIETGVR